MNKDWKHSRSSEVLPSPGQQMNAENNPTYETGDRRAEGREKKKEQEERRGEEQREGEKKGEEGRGQGLC